MRGLVIVVAALLALVSCGKADSPPAVQWVRTFGSAKKYGRCVRSAGDCGFAVAGDSFQSLLNTDMYVMRADSAGVPLWERCYGGPAPDRARAVTWTADGGLAVAGSGLEGKRAFVIKLDSTGNIQWTDSAPYGMSGALAVLAARDGGYVSAYLRLDDSVRLRKLDSGGGCEWDVKLPCVRLREWAGATVDVLESSDGGYVSVGNSLVKTDSLGAVQWWRQYADVTMLQSLQVTPDSGYVATGFASDPQRPDRSQNLVLLKVDSQGNEMWRRIIWSGEPTEGRCVRSTSDGGFFVVGYSSGPILMKFSGEGTLSWTLRVPGLGSNVADGGEQTSDGGYIVVANHILAKLAPDCP